MIKNLPEFIHSDPIFEGIDLTYNQQTYIRGKPIKYLKYTIDIFNKYTSAKVIVEVGSIRNKMNHLISDYNPVCCNDGHSTYFWNEYTNAEIYTIDINPNCKNIIISDERLNKIKAFTDDAISFLKSFNEKIDLLFLDAWDVEPNSPYAEEHLKAYLIVKDKLSDNCLILIDDTDIGNGGKGRLLIPELIKDGFVCLISGRQSLFAKILTKQLKLEEHFTQIYENKVWGDNKNQLYNGSSGEGSSLEYNSREYIPFLKHFINYFSIKSVIDLGCGDWQCGEAIYGDLDVDYTGYDAYKKIIDSNLLLYPKYSFIHLDFQSDVESIKSADLFILKDVLQHWKMDEIYSFLDKLIESNKYKFILIINCCNQKVDNPENPNRSTPLTANLLPLKKYNPKILLNYKSKEVSLISI